MISTIALSLLLTVTADEISPEKAATIERAETKAQAEVSKKFGDKKLSELTNEERQAMGKARTEAQQKVLEKEGVDAKTWAISSMKRGREATQQINAAKADQAKKEADAAQKKPAEPAGEVVIQQGFREDSPTVLEEKPGAAPIVETSLPAEAVDDQKAAEEASGAAAPETKPAKK